MRTPKRRPNRKTVLPPPMSRRPMRMISQEPHELPPNIPPPAVVRPSGPLGGETIGRAVGVMLGDGVLMVVVSSSQLLARFGSWVVLVAQAVSVMEPLAVAGTWTTKAMATLSPAAM